MSTSGRRIADIAYTAVGNWAFVTVTTEDGITGTGQSGYFSFPGTASPILDTLRPVLIGRDADDIGLLAARAYAATPFRGGALTSTIAAIDIALWDLKGHRYQLPSYQLMGGKHRDRVRLHVLLGMEAWPGSASRDDLIDEARRWVEAGFTAIKFDPLIDGSHGYSSHSYSRVISDVVDLVRDMREAVGWDVDIALEMHRKLGIAEAVAVAREVQPFRIYMYEDPIPPDSVDSLAEVASNAPLPVAGGERQDTIYEFREMLHRTQVEYVRPDVGTAGGLTACLKIAALAEASHRRVIAHNFHSPYLTLATLQLYAAIPNVGTFEWSPLDEKPPASALLDAPLDREGGFLAIPDGPGLGRAIVMDAIHSMGLTPRWPTTNFPAELDGSLRIR